MRRRKRGDERPRGPNRDSRWTPMSACADARWTGGSARPLRFESSTVSRCWPFRRARWESGRGSGRARVATEAPLPDAARPLAAARRGGASRSAPAPVVHRLPLPGRDFRSHMDRAAERRAGMPLSPRSRQQALPSHGPHAPREPRGPCGPCGPCGAPGEPKGRRLRVPRGHSRARDDRGPAPRSGRGGSPRAGRRRTGEREGRAEPGSSGTNRSAGHPRAHATHGCVRQPHSRTTAPSSPPRRAPGSPWS